MKVFLTTLGCAKNQVDSELILGNLAEEGHRICDRPEEAEAIVVNTCAFIEPAVEESIDTILTLARCKEENRCRRLVVCGCLPERYREPLAESLPEVDYFLGTGAFDRVPACLTAHRRDFPRCFLPSPDRARGQSSADPRRGAGMPYVYIKIAEGCDRRCRYCIIPRLRGRQRSRPPADIIREAEKMISAGAGELVLVAQETTAYGRDLTPAKTLADLLKALADLSPDSRTRVLYMHPASLDNDTINILTEKENLCSYFDIPIQHASDRLLKKMGRNHTAERLNSLFESIRRVQPAAALRTTVMTGFPGETEADFQTLMDFIRTVQFDHLGVFLYSDGDDLQSHQLPGHVPRKTAESRYEKIMTAQAEISLAANQQRLGTVERILLEEEVAPGLYEGRSWFQAPEVDGLTYVESPGTRRCGEYVSVRIKDAMEYDLTGETI